MMGRCRPETLTRVLDGGLSPADTLALEAHVRRCESCRTELDSLRRVDALVGALGQRERPFPARAGARIERTVERRRKLGPLLALSRMMPAAVGTSAAALLILVSVNIGVLYQSQTIPAAPGAASSPQVLQQSQKLSNNRRISAILGTVGPQQLRSKHQIPLNYN